MQIKNKIHFISDNKMSETLKIMKVKSKQLKMLIMFPVYKYFESYVLELYMIQLCVLVKLCVTMIQSDTPRKEERGGGV
jgi:hypothetical protein